MAFLLDLYRHHFSDDIADGLCFEYILEASRDRSIVSLYDSSTDGLLLNLVLSFEIAAQFLFLSFQLLVLALEPQYRDIGVLFEFLIFPF